MKQVLQNLRDGHTTVVDVPTPQVRPGTALVRTAASLVSAGTERMVVDFAKKSLVGKAKARPDLVRQVIDKAQREGIVSTIESVFNRMDQPMALGYSSAGLIVGLGTGMEGFQVGDRVACGGGNYAVHAEYGVIPRNLLVHIPDSVGFESAAFTTLGAVAMHGFRLARPQIGESVAVIGLGLLGLLAAEIAKAAGCAVFGIDLDPTRISLGMQMGIEAVLRSEGENAGLVFTHGRGFDVVLICADTRSNDPVELAGKLARDRAQIVAVGAFGMNIPRKIYYEKEIKFQVSRSYGPGRYDPAYEEGGRDYPAGYVRWTEGRNMESFIDLLAKKKIDLAPLITHRYQIDHAPEAYELIKGKAKEHFLGVVLTYPLDESQDSTKSSRVGAAAPGPAFEPQISQPALGVLGAGNYAGAVFLPAVKKVGGIEKVIIASASGVNARHAADKFGFQFATASEDEVFDDPKVNLLAILTRHLHHSRQVQRGLKTGKHVYCEKPLALTLNELQEIFNLLNQPETPLLAVGFNRRFSRFAVHLQEFLDNRPEPLAAHYRVNAGYLPLNHWTHDPEQGGGRIIGEGCHFVDFINFLVGTPPLSVQATALPDGGKYRQDNVIITLAYPDGSAASISYLANGDKTVPKEYLEVFCGGRVAVLDDFRTLLMVNDGKRKEARSMMSQDKGHAASWAAFLAAIRAGGPPPIPYNHIWGATATTFSVLEALTEKKVVEIPPSPIL